MLNENKDHDIALEALAVSVWREAESCADHAGWSRAYERLWGVQMYLTILRAYPAANTANDLKAIAAMRSGPRPNATDSLPKGGALPTRAHQNNF